MESSLSGSICLRVRPGTGVIETDLRSKAGMLYSRDASIVSIDSFELLKVIGRGSSGSVYKCRKKDDGRLFVMKFLRRGRFLEQHPTLKFFHHPFHVAVHWAFQKSDKFYVVLDFMEGGELFSHVNTEISESRARLHAAEIVLALEHAHAHGMSYRDLNTENILIGSDGHVRLADVGVQTAIDGDKRTFGGSSAEILYGRAVDWWSLGCVLFRLIRSYSPDRDASWTRMKAKVSKDELDFPSKTDADDLIKKLLARDPEKRLGSGAGDAEEIKAHPWFKGINWDAVFDRRVKPEWIPPETSMSVVEETSLEAIAAFIQTPTAG